MASPKPKFQIYQDKAGEWRWRLVASNELIVADSAEGYVSKSNIKRAIETVKEAVANANICELLETDEAEQEKE